MCSITSEIDIDVDEKLYTTATLCSIAGVKAVTFRAWRARNGLFPETMGGNRWNRFSIIDICIVRVIVLLIEHGLGAEEAISFVHGRLGRIKLDQQFWDLLRSNKPVIGFSRGDPLGVPNPKSLQIWLFDEEPCPILELMNSTGGVLTLIDLRSIFDHVLNGLARPAEAKAE